MQLSLNGFLLPMIIVCKIWIILVSVIFNETYSKYQILNYFLVATFLNTDNLLLEIINTEKNMIK